jgi:hypothetical protein
MLVRMHDAEIERILRASRTPLGISASGVASRMRCGVDPGRSAAAGDGRGELAVGERRPRERAVGQRAAGRVTSINDVRWIPEAEARRLRKVIRTSFCNSPHKKKYWTALLDMYAGPDAGKRVRTVRRHWAASAAEPARGKPLTGVRKDRLTLRADGADWGYNFCGGGKRELMEKLGRNDLCPCGSGRRFQGCCMLSGEFDGSDRDYFFQVGDNAHDTVAG